MESSWQWQAARLHQQELIDEAARYRQLRHTGGRSVQAMSGLRGWAALHLRRMADRLEPRVPPQIGVLRAVAHHELDVEQALRVLGPARPLTARR